MLALFVAGALSAWLTARRTSTDPAELGLYARDWPAPNHDLAATRNNSLSSIDSTSVGRLHVAWRFRFHVPALEGFSGVFASTPLVLGNRVYLQDLSSNVYAVDSGTGRLVWSRLFGAPDGGPNGLAAGDGALFGNSPTSTFALDLTTGRQLWRQRLTSTAQPMTVAPLVERGLVITSSTGFTPGGRGTIFGLDEATGRIRWRFDTIRQPWRFPSEANGGGLWYPPSIDGAGRIYAGNSNPYPWGGTRRRPNGGSYPGAVLYTDSLLVLDRNGRLRWFDQVTPHDVRDYDFQVPPVLTGSLVVGAGKSGRVIAWNTNTHGRVWSTEVGVHLHDAGALPAHPTPVCPGLLGGVETPMASSGTRIFVPVVDFCTPESAYGSDLLSFAKLDPARGRGELVALDRTSGRPVWRREFPAPDFGCATTSRDLVFTATFDGWIYALSQRDGRTLWSSRARAGVNACPALAGDLLLVGAGTDYKDFASPTFEVTAYRLK